MRLGSPKRKNKVGPAKEETKGDGTSVVPLTNILELDLCPEEWHHEYVYSRLLESMSPLITSIINDKTKWRIQELFIRKFGDAIQYYNTVEI